jgi:predicted ATPase with chaperone activity
MSRKVSSKDIKALERNDDSSKTLSSANPFNQQLSSLSQNKALPTAETTSGQPIVIDLTVDEDLVEAHIVAPPDLVVPKKPITTKKTGKEKKIDICETITLSQSQMQVLQAIADGKSVFFTGAAGSGKSFILRILQDLFNQANQREKIAFTAPTGVAACNIGGRTINSWAGIGLCDKELERVVYR